MAQMCTMNLIYTLRNAIFEVQVFIAALLYN
jgi:hypothetical protein